MAYYERNLPHWHPEGKVIFVTWRLHGACARFRIDKANPDAGRAFAASDRALGKAESGPKWLADERIAQCCRDALEFAENHLKLCSLISYVIMPNHVHLVLLPKAPLARISKSVKCFTARKANEILGRTGEPFWQDEGYDHWVRSEDELYRIVAYVRRNPVSAGLVEKAEDWRWLK